MSFHEKFNEFRTHHEVWEDDKPNPATGRESACVNFSIYTFPGKGTVSVLRYRQEEIDSRNKRFVRSRPKENYESGLWETYVCVLPHRNKPQIHEKTYFLTDDEVNQHLQAVQDGKHPLHLLPELEQKTQAYHDELLKVVREYIEISDFECRCVGGVQCKSCRLTAAMHDYDYFDAERQRALDGKF